MKVHNPAAAMVDVNTPYFTWYERLWVVAKLPYDAVRWLVTGRCYIGWWHGD